jgi:hypothetical protein
LRKLDHLVRGQPGREGGEPAQIGHQDGDLALLAAEIEAFRRFEDARGHFLRHVAAKGAPDQLVGTGQLHVLPGQAAAQLVHGEMRVHPGEQLMRVEGLGHVIHRAQLEALDDVGVSVFAVRKMTGMCRHSSAALRRRQVSRPSISGIITSSRTEIGLHAGQRVERLLAVGGHADLVALSFRIAARDWMFAGVSSTMRMRLVGADTEGAHEGRHPCSARPVEAERGASANEKPATCCSKLTNFSPGKRVRNTSDWLRDTRRPRIKVVQVRDHLLHHLLGLFEVHRHGGGGRHRLGRRQRQRGAEATDKVVQGPR